MFFHSERIERPSAETSSSEDEETLGETISVKLVSLKIRMEVVQ